MGTGLQTWKNKTKSKLEVQLESLKDENGQYMEIYYVKRDKHVKIKLDGESGNKLIQKLHYILTTKKNMVGSFFEKNTNTGKKTYDRIPVEIKFLNYKFILHLRPNPNDPLGCIVCLSYYNWYDHKFYPNFNHKFKWAGGCSQEESTPLLSKENIKNFLKDEKENIIRFFRQGTNFDTNQFRNEVAAIVIFHLLLEVARQEDESFMFDLGIGIVHAILMEKMTLFVNFRQTELQTRLSSI